MAPAHRMRHNAKVLILSSSNVLDESQVHPATMPLSDGRGERKSARASPGRTRSPPADPPQLEGSMAHRVLAHTDPGLRGVEPATVVGYLRAGEVSCEPQPHLDASGL